MGGALPGVYELRDQDANRWYRIFYIHSEGMIYVLHCFTKTTNQTSQSDINIARTRLTLLNQETAARKKKEKEHGKGKKHR